MYQNKRLTNVNFISAHSKGLIDCPVLRPPSSGLALLSGYAGAGINRQVGGGWDGILRSRVLRPAGVCRGIQPYRKVTGHSVVMESCLLRANGIKH